jgi:ribonuclease-3
MKKDTKSKELEKIANYKFVNKELLLTALTHKTFAFEAQIPLEYNERLEFLGDSILNFIVAEKLYQSNKYFSEGELTRRRSMLVNNNFLAKKAKELELGKYIFLGKGEKKQKGEKNPTILANMLEALIGAIYLDSDLNNIRKFILQKIFSKDFKF